MATYIKRMGYGFLLREDIKRTYGYARGSRLRKLVTCLRSPGVQAVVVFRFGQWLRTLPFIARLFVEPFYFIGNGIVQIAWGIELSRSAEIGPGLYIGHFGCITVSPRTVMGRNCTLSQQVTIGVSGQGTRQGVPVIGDNVYMAPGAKLFGKIRVGDNVKIGANSVVYMDIPDNAVVVLDPGCRIISYSGNKTGEA